MWKHTEAGSFPLPGIENEDSETALRRLAQNGNITMTSELLKARAKRLRPAITAMLGVPVGHSQSLELVAQEENYPNWDAACASYAPEAAARRSRPQEQFQLPVNASPGANISFAGLLGAAPQLVNALNQVLGNARAGALVLIGSTTAKGKSTTARVLVEHMLTTLTPGAQVLLVGAIDIRYPDGHVSRHVDEFDSCLGEGPVGEKIIVIDEIRTQRMAFEAVALAQAGIKVIATIHAGPSTQLRLSGLLSQFGVGEAMLDSLDAAGHVVAIHQTLSWSTPLEQRQANQQRQRGMLHRAGLEPAQIEQIITLGENAVFQALLTSTR